MKYPKATERMCQLSGPKKVFFFFSVFVAMSLLACSRPPSGCVVTELHNLSVCFERELFATPPSAPSDPSKIVMLSVPESKLSSPIGIPAPRTIDVWLIEDGLNFNSSLKRYLEDYENSDVPSEVEQGLIVRHAAKKDTGFFTEDLLYPQNGDEVFFVCARPWSLKDGRSVRVGCTAHVTWDSAIFSPRVELSYTLPREQLGRWKSIDQIIRNYVETHEMKK